MTLCGQNSAWVHPLRQIEELDLLAATRHLPGEQDRSEKLRTVGSDV